jgi:hypothetical protein
MIYIQQTLHLRHILGTFRLGILLFFFKFSVLKVNFLNKEVNKHASSSWHLESGILSENLN